MTNNKGKDISNTDSLSEMEYEWESYEAVTVENDSLLQNELDGKSSNDEDSRDLDIMSTSWNGMESGAINYSSKQLSNWYENIPDIYKNVAYKWANQQGMMRIIPIVQKQKFTYSTLAYIADKQEEPKTQTFPISDVSVVPHQITFDFYDTTEGRVGVSNAVEKHMSVECDVYLTDLLAQYWIFGDNNTNNIGLSIFKDYKKKWWDSVENGTYLNFEGDLENTPEFADFRNTFLQQHSGWVCNFASHAFGVFQGVINDVSYSIGSGETFAKWHLKLEEAIFTDKYEKTGQKAQEESKTSNGDTENSGAADDTEQVTQ